MSNVKFIAQILVTSCQIQYSPSCRVFPWKPRSTEIVSRGSLTTLSKTRHQFIKKIKISEKEATKGMSKNKPKMIAK